MTRIALVAAAVAALVAALPAIAATPIFNGTVGPGFTISIAKKPTKAGKIKLVVSDKASNHNFHLTGPGVNVKSSVSGTGTKTFTRDAEEGHVQVRLRPAREHHEGLVHGQVAVMASAGVSPRPLRRHPASHRTAAA